MLDSIKEKLREISENVYYGSADEIENTALWNYLVFWRSRISRSGNNTSFTDGYNVAIVNEEWVPVELIEAVIDKMESLAGMRLASSDITFEYSRKPSTNAVIEIAILQFSRARKKGAANGKD